MHKYPIKLLKLIEYQSIPFNKRLENLDKNILIQMPTGTGKGDMIIHQIIHHLDKSENVLVVVPNKFLVINIANRLKEVAPRYYQNFYHGVYTGQKKKFDTGLTIGVYKSIFNAVKTKQIGKYQYDHVIWDECHLIASDSCKYIAENLNAKRTGYTATPNRLDGKPLNIFFDQIYTSPSIDWFVDNGYLSPYKLYTSTNIEITESLKTFSDQLDIQQKILNNKIEIGQTIEQWAKYALGMKTIVFATGIDHARKLCEEFNSAFPQYKFEYLDSKIDDKTRDKTLSDFHENKITGIVNVEMLIMGVNVPDVQCVVLDRFTHSLTLYLQACGRALRYVPGKTAIIIDRVGNSIHGHPGYDHEWSLTGKSVLLPEFTCQCVYCDIPLVSKSKVARKPEGITIVCPNCGYENFFQFQIKKRRDRVYSPNVVSGDLVEFTATTETLKIYKILTSKILHHKKVEKILNINCDNDLKRKALKILNVSDATVELYLS